MCYPHIKYKPTDNRDAETKEAVLGIHTHLALEDVKYVIIVTQPDVVTATANEAIGIRDGQLLSSEEYFKNR